MDSGKPTIQAAHGDDRDRSAGRNGSSPAASAVVLAPLAIRRRLCGRLAVHDLLGARRGNRRVVGMIGLVEPSGRSAAATGICTLILQGVLVETGTLSIALMIIALGVLAAIVTAGKQAPLVVGGLIYAFRPADGDDHRARRTSSTDSRPLFCSVRWCGGPISADILPAALSAVRSLRPRSAPKAMVRSDRRHDRGCRGRDRHRRPVLNQQSGDDRRRRFRTSSGSHNWRSILSRLKRHFDVKDASGLIPGRWCHGPARRVHRCGRRRGIARCHSRRVGCARCRTSGVVN